jgi:hypothetical protein
LTFKKINFEANLIPLVQPRCKFRADRSLPCRKAAPRGQVRAGSGGDVAVEEDPGILPYTSIRKSP